MDFDWTTEEKELRAKVAALFRGADPSDLETADVQSLKAIIAGYLSALAGIGYLGVSLGVGADRRIMPLIAAQEELATFSGSLFLGVEVSARLFGGLLEGFGASEEVKRISESLSKGEIIGAVAMSESEESEPAPGHVTHGIVDGDAYVVTGKKQYVTNAPIADWFAIFGEAQGRPAVFLVQAGQKGVEVGPRLSTLGYNGMVVATLQLSKVRVPKELVLGPFEDRFPMDFVVFVQDLVLTLASVGLMQRTLTAAKDYAERRKRGGRPISRFQEIRFKLAEMLTMFQTAQLLAYRAAWLYGEHDPEARTVLHCAKVFASESAEQVATMAMQIMAGTGYISGNPVERAYRDAKFGGIAGSTSEVARMAIADDLLRRYKV